jgi:hypothetical protein
LPEDEAVQQAIVAAVGTDGAQELAAYIIADSTLSPDVLRLRLAGSLRGRLPAGAFPVADHLYSCDHDPGS